MSERFVKWTSIEKFSDTVISANRAGINTMFFVSKVKLHGSNAAVRVNANGGIYYQKRSDDITVDNDNFGFAAWASNVQWLNKDHDYIVYGEWAGCGINNKDAVTLLPEKNFFVFAVKVGDKMIICPNKIAAYIPDNKNIHIIPYHKFYDIDFISYASMNKFAEEMNEAVEKIGEEDHYIKQMFDISGPGEGFVVCPYSESGEVEVEDYNRFVFKCKTAAHTERKTPGVKVRVEVPPNIREFVNEFVTDVRCEQMYKEHCGDVYSMKNTPVFMKAIVADIEKESHNEREAGNIDMKDANKLIGAKAVNWLKSKCEGL